MAKYANDDMFIPVMPRILDPSLKFTENSILDSLEKSRINFKEDNLKKKESHVIDMPISIAPQLSTEKKSVITVIAKYKIHIILLISIILLVVIIYYVYKKYKSDKNTKVEEEPNISSNDNKTLECEEKVDNKKISSYLSNYITADDADEDSDTEYSEKDTVECSEKDFENDIIKNKNVKLVERNNTKKVDVFENIEVEEVDIIIPKNLSSIEEVEEVEEDSENEDDNWDTNIDFQQEDDKEVDAVKEEYNEEKEVSELSEMDMLLEDAEPQEHNPIDIFNKYK
jgi:Ca2+/Na+ antiporter